MAHQKLNIRTGKLPHWELKGALYFVTFISSNRTQFCDKAKDIIFEVFTYLDNNKYTLEQLVIMNDHCHCLLTPIDCSNSNTSLRSITHALKGYSARRIKNETKFNCPKVWQRESFDRIVRDKSEFERFFSYIQFNPVKAGLVKRIEDYKWYYSRS
jgi:REP element-mobilizing transposase RayT